MNAAILSDRQYTIKTLVLSTGHYSAKTDQAIFTPNGLAGPAIYLSIEKLTHGWQVLIPEDLSIFEHQQRLLVKQGHGALAGIMRLARDLKYDILKFDPDGPYLPESYGYRTFAW
jgi:hypothetical protein